MPARRVRLTNPNRVLFPDDGITKGDLFAYSDAVAPALVAQLRDCPFTMKRYREGIAGEGFFQKQASKGMPPSRHT
jgi:bifunctional non-homologous end joining protein LigD